MIKRNRLRALKIVVDEDRAKSIVLPMINLSAYLLSVNTGGEIPQLGTLQAALLNSKQELAVLTSNAITRVVNAKNLYNLKVECTPGAKHLKVSFLEKIGNELNPFSILFISETKTSMADIAIAYIKNTHPNASFDKQTELMAKFLMSI